MRELGEAVRERNQPIRQGSRGQRIVDGDVGTNAFELCNRFVGPDDLVQSVPDAGSRQRVWGSPGLQPAPNGGMADQPTGTHVRLGPRLSLGFGHRI